MRRIQATIAEECRRNPSGVDEDLGKLELKDFLKKRGVNDGLIVAQLEPLTLGSASVVGLTAADSVPTEGAVLEASGSGDGFGIGTLVDETDDFRPKFSVSYTLKKKFARLHRFEGCHRTPGKGIHDYAFASDAQEIDRGDFLQAVLAERRLSRPG